MNQTFTFADRLKSAMEQKHMKQVFMQQRLPESRSGRVISASMSVARRFLARRFFISYQKLLMSMLTGFLEMEGML